MKTETEWQARALEVATYICDGDVLTVEARDSILAFAREYAAEALAEVERLKVLNAGWFNKCADLGAINLDLRAQLAASLAQTEELRNALVNESKFRQETERQLRVYESASGPVKVPNILDALRNAQFAANGTHAEPGYISLLRRLSAYDMDLIRNALIAAPPKENG